MKKSDIVRLLGYRLEGRMDLGDRIDAELQYVQDTQLESNSWYPWFLLEEVTLTFAKDNPRHPLPADFIAEEDGEEYRAGCLYRVDTGGFTPMAKAELGTVLRRGLVHATPEMYAITGSQIVVAPTPSVDTQFQFIYYAKDAPMAEALPTDETLWMKHAADLVIALVGSNLATKHIQNEVLAASFQGDVQVAGDSLYRKHIAVQEMNMNHQLRSRN
jgi:hypothetical protein